ncbi:MAG: DUF167 domain-containing protein [Actinobacteria bacterium]|nr:DUF167 domain-containing protein [Actinomycetota bacterium]
MLARRYEGGSVIEVWLQPRASRASIVGPHERGLRVAVCSPPVGGRANDELLKLISKALDVPRGKVSIRSGAKSRNKLVYIEDIPPDVVEAKVLGAMASSKESEKG